jgi:hypothetical protein
MYHLLLNLGTFSVTTEAISEFVTIFILKNVVLVNKINILFCVTGIFFPCEVGNEFYIILINFSLQSINFAQ